MLRGNLYAIARENANFSATGCMFRGLHRMTMRSAVEQVRPVCLSRDLTIDVGDIDLEDLLALAAIWKLLPIKHVCVRMQHRPDDESILIKKIETIVDLLRRTPNAGKTLVSNDSFLDANVAPIFGDIVFDLVTILTHRSVRSSDIPRCREFSFPGGNEFHVQPTDALVPFVTKLACSPLTFVADAFTCMNIRTLRVNANDPQKLFALAALAPRVEKLFLEWTGILDVRVAAFVRRFTNVVTLALKGDGVDKCVFSEIISNTAATLPRLRRLRLLNSDPRDLTHLRKLPRLEVLRINADDVRASGMTAIARLPRLRSLVLDSPSKSIRDIRSMRLAASAARVAWVNEFTANYKALRRIVAVDAAKLVYILAGDSADRRVLTEVMREQPLCLALDGNWKIEEKN